MLKNSVFHDLCVVSVFYALDQEWDPRQCKQESLFLEWNGCGEEQTTALA